MNELLLLLDGLMKVTLCAGLLVLVATAPSRGSKGMHTADARKPESELPPQQWSLLPVGVGLARPWVASSSLDLEAGDVSPLGRDPAAIREVEAHEFDDAARRCTDRLFGGDDLRTDWDDDQPLINLDGTPMNGDMDLHGNAFGVSSCDHDLWD